MNRAQWMLTGVVAFTLALAAGLLLLVHPGQSMENSNETSAGEFDSAVPDTPLTARDGYLAALPTAEAWAEDAQLWRAQATWPSGSDPRSPAATWSYTFYSASRRSSALVTGSQGSVDLLRTSPTAIAPSLVPVESWQLDSPEAYELVYKSGGEAFLTVHPQHTVMLTLHADEPLRWQATLIDEGALGNRAGREMFSLSFSAKDGRLITTAVP